MGKIELLPVDSMLNFVSQTRLYPKHQQNINCFINLAKNWLLNFRNTYLGLFRHNLRLSKSISVFCMLVSKQTWSSKGQKKLNKKTSVN